MSTEAETRYAHSPPFKGGPYHLIVEHTLGVERLASIFAEELGLSYEARLAGLLHDLGKYGRLFQRRLSGEISGIDHWTMGAWVACLKYHSVEVALAVQGHHIGLQKGDKDSLRRLDPTKYSLDPANRGTLSEENMELLLRAQQDDGITLPAPAFQARKLIGADNMLRTRMLFSTLVDADFLDTESHFARIVAGPKIPRAPGLALEIDRALDALQAYQANLITTATEAVRKLRNDVSGACAIAADLPIGLFTLTAPTGSGKTLAMLRFALLHAKRHSLRRVIVVLPFLTLIEQTARIYRDVFKGFEEGFVLEDHSLVRDGEEDTKQDDTTKLLAENWDAPIIITTNVRFFEALHHNRPSVCRKLHRIAKSVVLCDEVQSLPLSVPIPSQIGDELSPVERRLGANLITSTLATLASLAIDFKTSVVFATATQPAFGEFDAKVREICPHSWKPTEIIPNNRALFEQSARVTVEWRYDPAPWEEIAAEVADQPGTLIVVNTRREATDLTKMLAGCSSGAIVLHLSTNMCVAHRQQVLQRVREDGVESDGFLVATQCVEAGVDLDFKNVYRAWAPLDAIAQAAGRCNRNGKAERGKVVVFMPNEARYPPGVYEQAVQAAMNTVRSNGLQDSEVHDPELFAQFFKRLYSATGISRDVTIMEERIGMANYVDVAGIYRLIPESGVNVIVRVGDRLGSNHKETNERLLDDLERTGLTGKLMKRLRAYTVSTFINSKSEIPLTPLKSPRKEPISGWFLLDSPEFYDKTTGLLNRGPAGAFIT